ncbi:MAG: hypothetical protein AB8G22_12260 [Saprospiraceae bacterium]
MPDTIPAEYLLTTNLQIPVGSHRLDFSIQYTLWGELIKAETLIHQLPLNAQKMMYGKDFPMIKSYLDQLPQLLHYQLPLALVQNARLTYLQAAVKQARQAQSTIDLPLRVVIKRYGQDTWIRFLYNVERNLTEKKLLTITNQLILLVQGVDKKIPTAVRQLRKLAPPLIFAPIIHALIPFQKAELRRYLYQQLGEIRLLQNRDFLLQQLTVESATHLRTKIINGLQNYSNKAVHEQLIQHYQAHEWGRDKYRELAALLAKIQHYANEVTVPIAKEQLLAPDLAISELARKILLKRGFTEAALVELLPDIFDENLLEIEVNTILEHYVTLRDRSLLPPPRQLLNLITLYGQRYPSAGAPMRVFNKLAILFQKGFQQANYVDILQLLRYNDDRLQRSGMHILKSLNNSIPLPTDQDDVGYKIIRQLFTLAQTAWTETRIEALQIIQKFTESFGTAEWLTPLRDLTQYSNPTVAHLAAQIMLALLEDNEDLRKGQLPFWVETINDSHDQVRQVARSVLQLYPREKVEKMIGGL